MMNLLALALLTSTLAAGGLFSPPPPPPPHPDPVLREGHRLIVVEYERQLPQDHPPPSPAADQYHETLTALPNLGQGLSTSPATTDNHDGLRDKICDAYGNCKDKLSSLIGKGKDKASGASDKVSGKATELETGARDAYNGASKTLHEKTDDAKDAVHRGKERLYEKAGDANDAANEVTEKLTKRASDVKDTLKKEKDKLSEKASDAVNKVTDTLHEKAGDAKYAASKVGEKISEKAAMLQEGAKDAADNISGTAEEAAANLTDIIKRARDVAYDAAKYAGAPETVKAVAAVMHLLAVSAAYGASMWVTFVSSHVLARALPRQQFGVVQSRLYPVYFRTMAYGTAVALLAHWLRRGVAGRMQGYNLAAVLAAALLNLLYFEPKATKVMFERMKLEKEEGRGQDVADVVLETPVVAASTTAAGTQTATFVTARTGVMLEEEVVKNRMVKLSRRLKKLNKYSSFLNILALMGLTWHLVHLGRCMPCK